MSAELWLCYRCGERFPAVQMAGLPGGELYCGPCSAALIVNARRLIGQATEILTYVYGAGPFQPGQIASEYWAANVVPWLHEARRAGFPDRGGDA